MIAASPPPRRHHTDIPPLETRPDTPVNRTRRKSTQGQGSLPTKPTPPLPSPSIITARAYFFELARRRSLIQGHPLPRRHSILPTTGNLVSQLENFKFTPAGNDLQAVSEGEETQRKIKTEDDDLCMNATTESTPVQQIRKSSLICGTPQEVLRQVPFQYTHDHLRDWGHAYLGNSETADAFVHAMSLRRPSLEAKDEFQVWSADVVTIRARVLPKAKERKPFLIQRQFNIDELRSRIPKPQVIRDLEADNTPSQPRRSSRIRRSSAWQAVAHQKKASGNCKTLIIERRAPLGIGTLPIHIEYALHYVPVLAALMLSGHVRKGDTIDLPIPHPESWKETVTYIYTGCEIPSAAVRKNISYLAGHGD
ncbi:hypothetical protein BGZ57DRAFT_945087 [Hyaloscypha finlandica]|nr:hypothetical protein BGZ57DRAFT_945087 [Hyaloscypha finlandica]